MAKNPAVSQKAIAWGGARRSRLTEARPNTRHPDNSAQPISNGLPPFGGAMALIGYVSLKDVLPVAGSLLLTFASSILI
jgi:hypothetical protein